MYSSEQVRQKIKAGVEIALNDGTVLKGHFFVNQQQRILDILNDERTFLPLEDSEGCVSVINKSTIARITPVEQKIERAKAIPTAIGR